MWILYRHNFRISLSRFGAKPSCSQLTLKQKECSHWREWICPWILREQSASLKSLSSMSRDSLKRSFVLRLNTGKCENIMRSPAMSCTIAFTYISSLSLALPNSLWSVYKTRSFCAILSLKPFCTYQLLKSLSFWNVLMSLLPITSVFVPFRS